MESIYHHNLVKDICDYLNSLPNVKKELICADIFENSLQVPRMSEGYIADVYYNYNGVFIIGEAKTSNDLERFHSLKQIESFANCLKTYDKNGYKCTLILATPWSASVSAYKIAKRAVKGSNVNIIIINESGVYKQYEKNNY